MEDIKRNSLNENDNLNSLFSYLQEDWFISENFKALLKSNSSDLCSNDFYENGLFEIICETGDDNLINFLVENQLIDNRIKNQPGSLFKACQHGFEATVDILIKNDFFLKEPLNFVKVEAKLDEIIAKNDSHLNKEKFNNEINKWLCERECSFCCSIFNGWVGILSKLVNHKQEYFKERENFINLVKICCSQGMVETFKYMIQYALKKSTSFNDIFTSEELLGIALKYQRFEIVGILISRGCVFSKQLLKQYPMHVYAYLSKGVPAIKMHKVDWQGTSLHDIPVEWLFSSNLPTIHSLNISFNHLGFLYPSIPWFIPTLNTFIASHSSLIALSDYPEDKVLCKRLEHVDVSDNEITMLPDCLFSLCLLTHLDISHNSIQQLPENTWRCLDSLKHLNASHNDLTHLPTSLTSCRALLHLDVSCNKLCDFPGPWNAPLELLDVSRNELQELKGEWSVWRDTLHSVNVSHNVFLRLPVGIPSLKNLRSLDASDNQLIYLPFPDTWKCTDIKTLNFSHNKLGLHFWHSEKEQSRSKKSRISIESLASITSTSNSIIRDFEEEYHDVNYPSLSSSLLHLQLPLSFASTLQELDLSHNLLTSLPNSIMHLTSLIRIDLSHNKGIKEFPMGLCKLEKLKYLDLTSIPFSSHSLRCLVQKGNSAHLLNSFKNMESSSISHRLVQLVVLGSKATGKSSLCEALCLKGSSFPSITASFSKVSSFISSPISPTFTNNIPPNEALKVYKGKITRSGVKNIFSKNELNLQIFDVPCFSTPSLQTTSLSQTTLPSHSTSSQTTSSHTKSPSHTTQPQSPSSHTTSPQSPSSLIPSPSIPPLHTPSLTKPFNIFNLFVPSCLYVVTFDCKLSVDNILDNLLDWLLEIQAQNKNAHVLLVGTFIDKTTHNDTTLQRLVSMIKGNFEKGKGFPQIVDVVLYCTNHGIDTLKDKIICAFEEGNIGLRGELCGDKKEHRILKKHMDVVEMLHDEASRRRKLHLLPLITTSDLVVLLNRNFPKIFDTSDDQNALISFLQNCGSVVQLQDILLFDHESLYLILCHCSLLKDRSKVSKGIVHRRDIADAFDLELLSNSTIFSRDFPMRILLYFGIIHQVHEDSYLVSSEVAKQRCDIWNGDVLYEQEMERLYKVGHVPRNFMQMVLKRLLVCCHHPSTFVGHIDLMEFWEKGVIVGSEGCHLLIEEVDLCNHIKENNTNNNIKTSNINNINNNNKNNNNNNGDNNNSDSNEDDVSGYISFGEVSRKKSGKKPFKSLFSKNKSELGSLSSKKSLYSHSSSSITSNVSQQMPQNFSKKHAIKVSVRSFKNNNDFNSSSIETLSETLGNKGRTAAGFKMALISLFCACLDLLESLMRQRFPEFFEGGNLDSWVSCPHCVLKERKQSIDSTATVTDGSDGVDDTYVLNVDDEPFVKLNSSNTASEACLISLKKCMECIILAESPNQLWVNCPKDLETRVSLIDLCPDLLLLDLPECYHNPHEDVVIKEEEGFLGRGGEGVVHQGVFRGENVAIKQSDVMHMNCTRNLKLKKRGKISLFSDVGVDGVRKNKLTSVVETPDSDSGDLGFDSKSLDSFLDGDFYQFKIWSAFSSYRQETTTLAKLHHPSLVTLLSVCPLSISYVMQLSPFGSLRHILDQRANELKTPIKYKMALQMTHALAYLHKHKFVYKDMKPGNILVWSLDPLDNVVIKLSDYGLTTKLYASGVLGNEGTAGYQAPEITSNKPYNQKVDIFAWAMVVYELFYMDQEFFRKPSVVISVDIKEGKRPCIKKKKCQGATILPRITALIQSAWCQKAEDRPEASSLVESLTNESTFLLQEIIDLSISRILGKISACCVLQNEKLLMWTGSSTGRCFHIYDCPSNSFLLVNQSCHGSEAICVTNLSTQSADDVVYVSLATKEPALEVYKVVGVMVEKALHYCLSSMPSCQIHLPHLQEEGGKTKTELFVGFVSGEVIRYVMKVCHHSLEFAPVFLVNFNAMPLLKHYDWSKAWKVNCMKIIHNDMWVSVGPFLVIATYHDIFIQPHHYIRLHCPNEELCVNDICTLNDQVWVLCQQKGYLIEFDSDSYDVISCLRCTVESSSIVDLNDSELKISSHKITKDSKSPVAEKNKINRVKDTKEDLLDVRAIASMKEKHSNSFLKLSKDFCTLSWNAEMRRSRRKISMRRKNKTILKNMQELQKMEQADDINARDEPVICKILCCKDMLWICFKNGKILLINSNQDNSSGMDYGSLVSILEHYNITHEDKKSSNNSPEVVVTPDAIKEIELTDLLLLQDTSKDSYGSEGATVISLISCKLRKVAHKRSQAFSWKALSLSDLLAQKKAALYDGSNTTN